MVTSRPFLGAMVVSAAAGLLLASWAHAQEKAKKESKKESKKEATPAAPAPSEDFMALANPGEAHKRLEPLVGTWETKMKVWMGGPGSPAAESQGSATTVWTLGKRFIVEEFKGELAFPDPASGQVMKMPFEGRGMTGYDNHRNLYVGTWADSMGTQLLTFSGSADPEGKVLNYYGPMDEPMLKVFGRTVRYETRILDADHHVFAIYDLHAGPDYKVIEITYTRKKP